MPLATAPTPPLWTLLPFLAMLIAIALMPLIFKHHWERFYHYWSVILGIVSVAGYLSTTGNAQGLLHMAHEYLGFMALIGSLFVVAGGIQITVKGEARPWANVVFLFVAAVASNLIGTTGASMLFIRPWIRMNRYRVTAFHIVFFIFIVSNLGGCLTPIGDPPLFLGFLKGVPFWWVFLHCWRPWAVAIALLLAIFFVLDTLNFHRAPKAVREAETEYERWRFTGLGNLAFLAVILLALFINRPPFLREGLMIAAALGSYFTTRKEVHRSNDFTLGPIIEVGWLFLGIFATLLPALDYLQANTHSLLLTPPITGWQLYWATGTLSAFLDNAPTYMAFLAFAGGASGYDLNQQMDSFVANSGWALVPISVAAVFFGAMTYIGNGPNFMVRALAEQFKVKTPDFFRYILVYSLPILLPVLFLVALLFFR